jgi:hypothetical protein
MAAFYRFGRACGLHWLQWEKARRSGLFELLFWRLAGRCRLGFRRTRLGVLSNAIVDEVTPLDEVDGGILLGCLGLT